MFFKKRNDFENLVRIIMLILKNVENACLVPKICFDTAENEKSVIDCLGIDQTSIVAEVYGGDGRRPERDDLPARGRSATPSLESHIPG